MRQTAERLVEMTGKCLVGQMAKHSVRTGKRLVGQMVEHSVALMVDCLVV